MFGFKTIIIALGASCLLIPVNPAKAVVATIQNDLKTDDPGSVLEITDIKGKGVPPTYRVIVMPGETKRIFPRNVFAFTVSRVYGTFKEKFEISCPEDQRVKDNIHLNLDNIRENALPAGCTLGRTGRWSLAEGTTWEERDR